MPKLPFTSKMRATNNFYSALPVLRSLVKKENMILGDFWHTDSNDASDNSSNLKNDKIDAWRKIVDNLLG